MIIKVQNETTPPGGLEDNTVLCLGLYPQTLDINSDIILLLVYSKKDGIFHMQAKYSDLLSTDNIIDYLNKSLIAQNVDDEPQCVILPYIKSDTISNKTKEWLNTIIVKHGAKTEEYTCCIFPSILEIINATGFNAQNLTPTTDFLIRFSLNFYNGDYVLIGNEFISKRLDLPGVANVIYVNN